MGAGGSIVFWLLEEEPGGRGCKLKVGVASENTNALLCIEIRVLLLEPYVMTAVIIFACLYSPTYMILHDDGA